ncbi:adenylate/guanylate cyclase domain-containing protein [Paraburkholderia terrae]|uniref:adenylate/guanylate cyclase domain-containing protein n=1 Tax=Paraburkholderia terrae TaxID=311230 RepID=UPI002065B231|nr:adenylate/guanylate cyclase domain-containing protein [Paraburkholderia terrae]BDC44748.1 hypothetical protein PTKU15_80450 [Paraburkholderia terrae]
MLKGKAAIGAVDATLRAIDEWRATRVQCGQPAPDVGAGIASGLVLSGIVGDGKRLEYTVIGDAINLAAKPEKHNKLERTRAIASHATYAQDMTQGYAEVRSIKSARSVVGVAGEIDLVVWAS